MSMYRHCLMNDLSYECRDIRYYLVRWLDVSMDNRKLLTMQVVNSLDDGAHDGHGVGPGKPLFRLLLPQCVQIWPFDILHQYVYPSVPVIIEHFIDMRESFVRRLPEQ